MQMNAQQMFEELGYKKEYVEMTPYGYAVDTLLVYQKGANNEAIVFSLQNEAVWTCKYEDIHNDEGFIYGLLPKEIVAITQQMKELGWIE
jgi:hypothetical protein